MPLPLWAMLAAILGPPLLGALFESRREQPDVKSVPTLTPEQQRVASQLASLLSGQLGLGVAPYTGALAPEVPGALRQSMASVADLLGAPLPVGAPMPQYRPSTFGREVVEPALARVLSGAPAYQVDFEATQRALTAAQAPALRAFREEILPAVREQFVGTGQFWGTARQQAEAREASRLAEALAAQRAQATLQDIEAQRQAALEGARMAAGALPAALSYTLEGAMQPFQAGLAAREQAWRETLGAYEARLGAARALAGMAGLQYQMEQNALERAYQEWLRTRPEASPYLQMAFQFLGVPMIGLYQPPYQPSPWAVGASILGQLLGGWLLGQV